VDTEGSEYIPPLAAFIHWQTGNKLKDMKFINYLESITGVDIFGLSSFMIFFTFFVIMSLWAWKADKKMIDKINRIPLDN
jgi:hypothetical protein